MRINRRCFTAALAWVTLGFVPQGNPAELPAWLQVSQATLDRMYGRGITDAGRGVKLDVLGDKVRRSIGQIDANPLRDEAESFVWLIDPCVQAYQFGWRARHDDWTSEELRQTHDNLIAWAAQGRRRLTFQVVLNVLRNTPTGPITHPTAPQLFRDVQVQLKVAGRRYEPERQPGDLNYLAGPGTITTTGARPSPQPVRSVASGPGEIASGGAAVTNYFTVYRAEKYEFYQGNFTVVFDLFDPDGSPRVRPKDVGVSAIVVTAGGNEREAKYTWDDLMALRVQG